MITLEAFTGDRRQAVAQAFDLRRLVRHEKQWLKAAQPGTYARYENESKAVRSITRITRHRNQIEAHIVRRDRVAIGLATIIFDQQLVHPAEGSFQGDDLDYWLQRGEDIFTHRDVARRLLAADHNRPAMATIVQGHPNPARGLERVMQPVGEVASLSTGERPDPYEIARQGAAAQLYIFTADLQLPPAS